MPLNLVGRTSWSAADVLVGSSHVLQIEQAGWGRRRGSGEPPYFAVRIRDIAH